jgi:hypothetical protein
MWMSLPIVADRERERERKKKKQKKTAVSGGDRCELSVCLIHPQSDAHMTKVWNPWLTNLGDTTPLVAPASASPRLKK